MSKLTKNQKLAAAKIEEGKAYTVAEAAALVKEITTTKFDASVDIDVRLLSLRLRSSAPFQAASRHSRRRSSASRSPCPTEDSCSSHNIRGNR